MNILSAKRDIALVNGEAFLYGTPTISYIFQTNASGGIEEYPSKDTAAYDLLESVATACEGMSIDFFNDLLPDIETIAIEMGRNVSRGKEADEYFTTISPMLP